MNIVDIIYVRYFKEDGTSLSIGGVESYITQLAKLFQNLGLQTRVFQYGTHEFVKQTKYASVYAFHKKGNHNGDYLLHKASKLHKEGDKWVTIIANDTLIPSYKMPNSIAIQHGIGFDTCFGKKEALLINFIKRAFHAYPFVHALQNVDKVVCVDNNFINWYRTQTTFRNVKLIPIMNFTEIGPATKNYKTDKVRIVFARRFVELRGTRLFAPVASRLLKTYANIEIMLAGGGPDEEYLKTSLVGNPHVKFGTYNAEDSLDFHSKFDIAVVPTLYSEGTSLSLLEAMSAHCAVVCTNVGGMTNIILDEFNGLMITPDEDELFSALSRLIEDVKLRERLSCNAYETIKYSFSLEKWQKEWRKIILEYF